MISNLERLDFVMNQVFWIRVFLGLTESHLDCVMDILRKFTAKR